MWKKYQSVIKVACLALLLLANLYVAFSLVKIKSSLARGGGVGVAGAITVDDLPDMAGGC